ncbi:MAG: DUF4388 domain-containing protein [Thermoanaerobaculia bacterium]
MNDPSIPRFQYRSDLGSTPLPEVLLTIHRHRVPGVVECSRGDEIKQIFIDGGNIVFASSNRTVDSLGDRMLASGRITQEQYDESVRRLTAEGNSKRQGAILVEIGALQPKELFVNVVDQVQSIVWSIFDWESGAVLFEPGRGKKTEFIKLAIPIPQAVMRGIRSMSDPKRLLTRVGGRQTVLERDPDRLAVEIKLDPDEQSMLAAIDGKRSLEDLLEDAPVPAPLAARLVYGLHILGLTRARRSKTMKVQFRTRGEGRA